MKPLHGFVWFSHYHTQQLTRTPRQTLQFSECVPRFVNESMWLVILRRNKHISNFHVIFCSSLNLPNVPIKLRTNKRISMVTTSTKDHTHFTWATSLRISYRKLIHLIKLYLRHDVDDGKCASLMRLPSNSVCAHLYLFLSFAHDIALQFIRFTSPQRSLETMKIPLR